MIAAAIIFLSHMLLGYRIVSFFDVDARSAERFLYSLVSGFVAGNSVLFVSYLVFGMNAWSMLLPSILIIASSKTLLMKFSKGLRIGAKGLRNNSGVLLFFAALLVLFSYISYTHLFQPKSDGIYSAGYTWADLPFHTGIINSFVENSNPKMEYMIYAGVPLHYHFMVDFSTAALIAGGLPMRTALIFINTIFLFSGFLLFYFFAKELTKNKNTAVLAVILFLFTGGLGFLYFIEDSKNSGLNIARDYTAYTEKGIQFGNPLTDSLLPQRGYLIGFPVLFIVFSLLWKNLTQGFDRRKIIFPAMLIGLLPLFHLYSFFASIFVYFTLFALFLHKDRKKIIYAARFFAVVAVLALPQMFWYFSKTNVSFVRFYLGWLATPQNTNWLWFWVLNLGVFFVVAAPAYFAANANMKKFALPFIGLFAIGNAFILQPNAHYNITLFYIWNVMNVVIIASFLHKIFSKGLGYKILAAGIVFLAVFSGFLSVAWETQSSWREFEYEEVQLSEWVKENTAKDSLFLTSTAHNHFVHALSGRQILMGYRGSLWSHAIDYSQREKDVALMFAGGSESANLLAGYGVDYVVIGPTEKSEFQANENFFDSGYQVVKSSANYKIYKA